MSCLICGTSPTIRSHLIPKVMATEVKVGVAHAIVYPNVPGYRETQSGLIETDILCRSCDSSIGIFEDRAAKAFKLLRHAGVGVKDGSLVSIEQAPDVILRFYAALLWKYAAARSSLGQIDLGPFKIKLQTIAFEDAPIPDFFDAALMRLRLHKDDAGVFAYRAPSPDRQDGLNLYRILVGGVLAFVKVDRRLWGNSMLGRIALGGSTTTRACVLPAQAFEEFKVPQRLVNHDVRLSAFLDRQGARISRKT